MSTTRPPDELPWWREAVTYQIYPRSFADADGDGIGDLEGLRARLDHLAWLGVDALWLSPVYRSPMADFGYDVSDHCDVDPLFGDLAAMDRLIDAAHRRGLRVLLDWVPNHTSDQHPWFVESRSSRTAPRRDWYIWRDGRDGGPPNNWRAAFGGPAWTVDEATGQWYLHLFLPQQPDLDWSNPEVVEAQHDVLRFWADRGVDGFRADVVHLIGKDPALTDQPAELVDQGLPGVHDHPATHPLLRGIRRVLDAHPGRPTMVGEVNLATPALLAPYYGGEQGDELPMVFNFTLLRAPWDAAAWHDRVAAAEAAYRPGDWPAWVLSNHDEPRHRTRYDGSEARARVAALVLLTLRGMPFLYAGEELGLTDAVVPDDARVDPGGRDGCRAPLPWEPEAPHGWPGGAWLPFPPEAGARSVAAQRDDPGSILHLYRAVLAARRASPALRRGSWQPLDAPAGVLAYERRAGDDVRRVVANFTDGPVAGPTADGWQVELASSAGGPATGTPAPAALGPSEAVLLRPAG